MSQNAEAERARVDAEMTASSSSTGTLDQQLRLIRARRAAAEEEARKQLSEGSSDTEEEEDQESHTQRETNLAHAQSHNPVESLLPSPPRSPPRAIAALANAGQARLENRHRPGKTVTVRDIKNRTCWICSDGDDADGKPEFPSKRWVHPCKCSLIAHETCLLTWIRSKRASGSPDPNRTITCPQCSHPYTISESKPLILQVFEVGDGVLRSVVPIAGAGVVGGGVLVAATAYGCTAIRLWMGERAAKRTLGGHWPWHFYFDIPLIPFVLILSRLRFLDRAMMWLPSIVAFPMTHVPFAKATLSWTHPYAPTWTWRNSSQQYLSPRIYPPGPALTILLVPWVRVAYLSLKRKITRRVLSGFVQKHSRQSNAAAGQTGRGLIRRRVIIVGQGDQVVDGGGVADVGLDAQGEPREVPPGADAVDDDAPLDVDERQGEEPNAIQQTIYVTPQSLGRLCLGALSTPLIANIMGKLLAKIAGWSYWLRRLLGMQLKPAVDSLAQSFKSSSSTYGKTPLSSLFSSGSALRRQEDLGEEERILYGQFDDLDPVWFRNAIGAGLFIVAKDAVQLSFRYLRLSHARAGTKRTKVQDRPFEGSMIDSLELNESAST